MLGINPKNMLDASIYDIMTPAAARSFESRVYSSVSAKKTSERIEANCMHADGSPRILDFSVSLSYSKDNFVRVYAIGRDITEKRKLFNQLMQKERILESLSVKLSRVLNSTDYEADIHDLLHGLCGTLSVSHGFIFQNYFDEPHVRCAVFAAWSAVLMAVFAVRGAVLAVCWAVFIVRWARLMVFFVPVPVSFAACPIAWAGCFAVFTGSSACRGACVAFGVLIRDGWSD